MPKACVYYIRSDLSAYMQILPVYPLNYRCFLSAVDLQVNLNVSYSSPVLVLNPPSDYQESAVMRKILSVVFPF